MDRLEDSLKGLRARDEIKNISVVEKLKSQYEEYSNFENAIKFQEKVMVHLGDGYIISKNRQEALQFLHRRKLILVSRIKEEMSSFGGKADNEQFINNKNDESETKEYIRGGFPLVDIQEKLDQNDNIVEVHLNDKFGETLTEECKKNSEPQAVDEKYTTRTKQITKGNEGENYTSCESLKCDKEINSDDAKNELQQLYEDMEVACKLPEKKIKTEEELMQRVDKLAISDNDKEEIKRLCFEGFSTKRQVERESLADSFSNKESTVTSLEDFKQIDTHNLLELEVLANGVDGYDECDSESGDSYNLSADQDDSDEDVSNYLLYGGDSVEHNLPTEEGQEQSGWNQALWKRIIDLRRSENTESIKMGGNTPRDQRKSVKFANEVEVNEIESSEDGSAPQKISRFKEDRSRSKLNNVVSYKEESAPYEISDEESAHVTAVSSTETTSPNTDSEGHVRNLPLTRLQDATVSSDVETTFVADYQELDDLARDYVRGKFDDDLGKKGIIIDKVEDINNYNDHVQTSRSSSSSQCDDSNDESELVNKDMAAAESDSYINDIVDKPLQIPEDVERQIFDKQIRDDYYKIRNHMSSQRIDEKLEQFQDFESNVNNDGASGRVSKFKLSRLHG